MSDETRDIRPSVTELSHRQTTQRMEEIASEIRKVAEKDTLSDKDDDYLRELKEEFDELTGHARKLERKALIEKVDATTGNPITMVRGDNPRSANDLDRDIMDDRQIEGERGFHNPWDLSEMRTFDRTPTQIGSELRARALSAIEKMRGASDNIRQAATSIIEEHDSQDGRIARMALVTSHPDYLSAFNKAARGRENSLNEKERNAVERAMSLTDAAGGYLVPFQLDPTVIITSDGSLNEIRQAARQVVATGDVWNGVSSGAVVWDWFAEAAESTDDATTFVQPTVPIHTARGFVPISLEALQDEQNVGQEVGRLLAFGKDTLEAAAFATGTGSGQPTGIVTALTGGASEISSATTDTFAAEDVYGLDDVLPARYRSSASWLANRAIYNDIRQFDTAGGAQMWERIGAGMPSELIGRPAYESEDMDGAITALAENYALIYGAFRDYVIADRIGTTVEFIPHLFATANNLPSGQRGWFAYYRVGADSVNDGAFRMLNVT